MFNYANSIEIVLEQSDNMLRLMNIYQRELKKLIVLHDRVQEEAVCGTRTWRGDWTETGVEIVWGVLQAKVFHVDSQDGNALQRSVIQRSTICRCIYFSKVCFLSKGFFPPSFSRSPLKL